jgi:hypothetical protein
MCKCDLYSMCGSFGNTSNRLRSPVPRHRRSTSGIPLLLQPFPALALTDKVPKLLGARFTIRNGAIIIKRDSREADAVLAPN